MVMNIQSLTKTEPREITTHNILFLVFLLKNYRIQHWIHFLKAFQMRNMFFIKQNQINKKTIYLPPL